MLTFGRFEKNISDMERLGNFSVSGQQPKTEPANGYLVTLFVSVTLAILILNGFIIGLMKYYPEVLKKSFSLHILTLCFTDFAVGLSGIPIVYIYIYQHEIDYYICASIFGTYSICQVIALYHVLGICIHRVLILQEIQRPLKWKRQYLTYHVIAVWFFIPVVISLPFILWGQVRKKVEFCSLDTIFLSCYNTAVGYMIFFFWLAVVWTNSLYVYLQIVLFKRMKMVIPSTCRVDLALRSERETGLPSDTNSFSTTGRKPGLEIQMRTLRTFGVVLLLLNILTLPMNLGYLLEVTMDSVTLTRKQRLVITSITYLNSAVNPFIYAARIPELRECMLKPFYVFRQKVMNVTQS